jgi:hypothetical protein
MWQTIFFRNFLYINFLYENLELRSPNEVSDSNIKILPIKFRDVIYNQLYYLNLKHSQHNIPKNSRHHLQLKELPHIKFSPRVSASSISIPKKAQNLIYLKSTHLISVLKSSSNFLASLAAHKLPAKNL